MTNATFLQTVPTDLLCDILANVAGFTSEDSKYHRLQWLESDAESRLMKKIEIEIETKEDALASENFRLAIQNEALTAEIIRLSKANKELQNMYDEIVEDVYIMLEARPEDFVDGGRFA